MDNQIPRIADLESLESLVIVIASVMCNASVRKSAIDDASREALMALVNKQRPSASRFEAITNLWWRVIYSYLGVEPFEISIATVASAETI